MDAYDHRLEKIQEDHYRMSWTVDTKDTDSGELFPQTISEDTDQNGAIQFAKKWQIVLPLRANSDLAGDWVGLANYPTSRDYARLAQLARHAGIICVVDFAMPDVDKPMRDVAVTAYQKHRGRDLFQICARGTGYLTAFSEDEFVRICGILNVEFIDPDLGKEQG